tara:strand:+ start:382 stop:561 length:180 start_codon:yes stop_codon:yes gene_type:complete
LTTKINFTPIFLYGVAFGIVYYNPNLEPDRLYKVKQKDYYEQISIMFLIFGLHITIWKE